MAITLQLVTSSGWGSALIRWRTWSDYSHVDFVLPDGKLLGARSEGGVQIRPANYENFTKLAQYQIEAPQAVLDYAQQQIGKPYDMRSIINFGLHRDWREDDSWFCSELVAASFEHGGFPLLNIEESVSRVSPRDITLSPYLKRIK
jgi:uncharacterized protein YycO